MIIDNYDGLKLYNHAAILISRKNCHLECLVNGMFYIDLYLSYSQIFHNNVRTATKTINVTHSLKMKIRH